MASSSSVHAVATNTALLLKAVLSSHDASSARFPCLSLVGASCLKGQISLKGNRGGFLNAAKFTGIEQDIPELEEEDLRTAGEGEEFVFPYGIIDGHHTFHKEDANIDVWEAFKEPFIEAGGPTGFQAYLGWGTLPLLFLMVAYGVQVEYIFGAFVLFIFAFVGIEMDKPDLDHEFPPEVYMERRKKRMQQSE